MKPIQAPRKIATLLLYTEGKMTDESSDMKVLGHVSQAFHYGYIADPWEKKRKAPVITAVIRAIGPYEINYTRRTPVGLNANHVFS